MRIATWNLERPRNGTSERSAALRKCIEDIDADIWILTETHTDISPGPDYQGFAAEFVEGLHSVGESRTVVWSRLKVRQQIPTKDFDRAICVDIESTLGPMLVYGTVIPYGGAGTNYGYRFLGQQRIGQKGWQLHYESIVEHDREWCSIREQYPDHYLCVGGDFNQSRDGRRWGDSNRQWYGTNKGRAQLTESMSRVGLQCVTEEDFVQNGKLHTKSSVDHLSVTGELESKISFVGAWEPDLVRGKPISDHNGVFIDLE